MYADLSTLYIRPLRLGLWQRIRIHVCQNRLDPFGNPLRVRMECEWTWRGCQNFLDDFCCSFTDLGPWIETELEYRCEGLADGLDLELRAIEDLEDGVIQAKL